MIPLNLYDCEICGLSFTEIVNLTDHMEQHVDDVTVENKVFDCTNCRRSFFNITYFDQHNQMMHSPQ